VNLVLWAQWAAPRLKVELELAAVCQPVAERIPNRIPVSIPIHHQVAVASLLRREAYQAEAEAGQWDAPDVLEEFQAAEE
jgi:hypothetical protein